MNQANTFYHIIYFNLNLICILVPNNFANIILVILALIVNSIQQLSYQLIPMLFYFFVIEKNTPGQCFTI